jgi:hypothetical protein
MTATPGLSTVTPPTASEPLVDANVGTQTPPKSQPLWRFALVGLGPLTALGVFALVIAVFQHVA